MVKFLRSSLWVLLVAILLTAGVVFAFSPVHAGKSPGLDASLFMYIGAGINKGQVLYRDLWDNKPPLIFFLDAFALRLAGGSGGTPWGVWAADLAAWLLSVVLLFLLLRKELGRAGLLFALLIFVLNLPVIFGAGNMTETYALPCQLAGVYFFTRVEGEGRQPRMAFCLGVAFALAFLLKQTTIGVWIALAGYVMLSRLFAARPVKLYVIVWAAAGAAVVTGAVLAYFAVHQALGYFWDAAFRFNYYYARASVASHAAAVFGLLSGWSLLSSIFPLGVLAWVAGALYVRRAGWEKSPLLLRIALIDLPIECGLLGVSANAYQHYLVSMLPGLVILNGFLVHFVLKSWSHMRGPRKTSVILRSGLCDEGSVAQLTKRSFTPFRMTNQIRMQSMQRLRTWLRFFLGLGAAVYLLLLFLAVFQGVKVVAGLYTAHLPKQVSAALEYIDKHSSPKDAVLVWGYHPEVNFLSGRSAPSRFIHQIPLYTVGYATPQVFAELLADLQKTPPKLIIDTHTNRLPFLKMQNGRCVLPGGDLPQGMAEVFAYICAHYHDDGKIGSYGWSAFTLDTSPPQ